MCFRILESHKIVSICEASAMASILECGFPKFKHGAHAFFKRDLHETCLFISCWVTDLNVLIYAIEIDRIVFLREIYFT